MKDQAIKNEVTRAIVLEAVLAERERQDTMYGNQSNSFGGCLRRKRASRYYVW